MVVDSGVARYVTGNWDAGKLLEPADLADALCHLRAKRDRLGEIAGDADR